MTVRVTVEGAAETLQHEDDLLLTRCDGAPLEGLDAAQGWHPIADPFAPEDGLHVAALRVTRRGGAELEVSAAPRAALGALVFAAQKDHLSAVVADQPEERSDPAARGVLRRSSKDWLYDMLGNIPGLLGVDHSVGLLLPDSLGGEGTARYVLAAERLLGERGGAGPAPEHLVGLMIPCEGGRGGLLEAALRAQEADPALPYHLFIPSDASGQLWQRLGEGLSEPIARFQTSARRGPSGMTALVPVALPGRRPGFLSLNWRRPAPLGESQVKMLAALRARFGDALLHSDLFQVAASRMALLDCFRAALAVGPCLTRRALVRRLTPHLHEALGALSVSVGLLEAASGPRSLVFENPQGWDPGEPRRVPLDTTDTLSALAIRLGRPLVLAGGRTTSSGVCPARFYNALQVHEQDGLIEDARMGLRDYDAESGWRPLANYYKSIAREAPVYAAVAVPITLGDEALGVISLDFDRHTPWTAYSGLSAAELYRTLAGLIASHLALLPTAADADEASVEDNAS